MDLKDVPVNPLIALREKHKEELVEITGHIGAKTDTHIHLYPDALSAAYLEIPVKSVLQVEPGCKDCGNETKITIFVTASTEVRLIEPMKASGFSPNKYGPFGTDYKIPPPYSPPISPIRPILPDPGDRIEVARCISSCIDYVKTKPAGFFKADCNDGEIVEYPTRKTREYLVQCLSQCGMKGKQLEDLVNMVMGSLYHNTHMPCQIVGDDFNPWWGR